MNKIHYLIDSHKGVVDEEFRVFYGLDAPRVFQVVRVAGCLNRRCVMSIMTRRCANAGLSVLILALFLAACGGGGGGGGGGDGDGSEDTQVQDWASADLRGHYRFNYTGDSDTVVDHRYVVHMTMKEKTSEGTDFYGGYNIDAPSDVFIALAWYPSLGSFVAATNPFTPSDIPEGMYSLTYVFNVEEDGGIRGCFHLYNVDTEKMSRCYSLNQESHKYPLGSWERSAVEGFACRKEGRLAVKTGKALLGAELDEAADREAPVEVKELISAVERLHAGD